MARLVVIHFRCPLELWMLLAIGAMQNMGRLWWDFAHTTSLEGRVLE